MAAWPDRRDPAIRRPMSSHLLADLNPVQRQAVLHPGGPLLVLAGAGSGKTRVLTYRVAYLLAQGVLPYRVLCVTFTNKAANEMRERIRRLVGPSAQHCWIGTFHATCARLLRTYGERLGLRTDFVVFDDSDQVQLVRECMGELQINPDLFKPRAVLAAISRAKEQLLLPETFGRTAVGETERVAARVYPLYQERLRQHNALDFDDLIFAGVQLLQRDAEIRETLQQRFEHLLVDEYQDINEGQYELVRSLAAHHRNLCVVGDDDQSIYSWRGADVRFILAFEQDYPDATVLQLEQNYRSTQKILDAANRVIARIHGRRPKRLFTENPCGESLSLYLAEDEADEARYVVEIVEEAVARGRRRYGDFAVLYRTNAQSRALEDAFRRERIPYRIVGTLRFYDRKEIKDLIAYLRLLVNPADSLSARRIVNAPPRSIGARTMERLEWFAREQGIPLLAAMRQAETIEGITPRARTTLRELVATLDRHAERARREEIAVSELVKALIRDTGYAADLEQEGTVEAQGRLENLQELINVAAHYDREVGAGLVPFLEQIALMSDQDALGAGGDVVTIMTLHAAKGLEFPAVFLVGLEEGLFPHIRALTDDRQMDEERRLCYVGITRAREELYLTSARRRMVRGHFEWQQPSRFLREIPDELFATGGVAQLFGDGRYAAVDALEFTSGAARSSLGSLDVGRLVAQARAPQGAFQPGDRVRHPTYGEGIVTQSRGSGEQEIVSVAFPGEGVKQLVVGYARLERLE